MSQEKQQPAQQQQQYMTPVQLFFIAKELQKQGKKVIFLSAGEPDYPPPPEVIDATYNAMKEGHAHYAPSKGIPELRRALTQHLSAKYRLSSVTPDQVAVTVGGRFAIFVGLFSLAKPGDEAIIVAPDWSAYRDVCGLLNVRVKTTNTFIESNWNLNLDQMRSLITEKTKVLIISYPHNPTGKVLDEKHMDELVGIAAEHGITIMSDEVYSEYVYKERGRGSNAFKSILEYNDCKYFYLTSFSKTYAMTGFRMGYCVSDAETMKKVEKLQSIVITSIPEFIQYGGIKALECKESVRENVQRMSKRVDATMKILREYSVDCYYPDGGLYVFPKVQSKVFDSSTFAFDLLKEHYVSIANGQAFGGQMYGQYFRLALVEPEDILVDGLEKIGKALKQKEFV
jgi:aspartate aminotransferase